MNTRDSHHDPHSRKPAEPNAAANDAYLWDASGEATPEVAALELALSPLKWNPSAPSFKRDASALEFPRRRSMPWRAAAALLLAVAGVWMASVFSLGPRASGSMSVLALGGSPRIAGRAIPQASAIAAGQWLETDAASSAQIIVAEHGTVTVDPDSRLRLVQSKPTEHRLELARGSMRAFINAPPRLFVVDTPAATAFDLGCAYNLRVDDDGNGEIEVTLGWVSMENHGFKSLVPYGAKCLTRKARGVGTPFFADASGELILALAFFDFGNGGEAAIDTILHEASARDSLTLWHLLLRTKGETRARVLDRLIEFAPPPAGVTREQVLAGDEAAIDEWGQTMVWSPNLVKARPH